MDLDPLAVELCRLALWIETMDRGLPFSFLDHKIKCGNALIGAWFNQFQHYPVMAWKNREGGDKNHSNGVHFEKEARTKAIKSFVKDALTPDLRRFLAGPTLLSEDQQERASGVHADALATLARLHDLPVQDSADRARIYRDELLGSPAHLALGAAMDLWCACWFWPVDDLDHAPLPTTFASPPPETVAIATHMAAVRRFFHWEFEFPDVFRAPDSGFDAMLGNPPWDIAKPKSQEFFSDIDPLYRSYGRQEALRVQTEYFADEALERDWLDYGASFRAQSNYMAYAASPFGDPVDNEKSQDRFSVARGHENAAFHDRWRDVRATSNGFSDAAHAFRHQGSADLNLYKAFLEQAHALLRRGGRLGFIAPSSIYSDQGSGGLRQLFLDHCSWEWLFGFENRDKVFAIDSRFKFNPIIVQKGGKTKAIRTAFMRRRLEDWEHAEALETPYSREQVERFSPRSKTILEIQSPRDLEILEKIYTNSVLLGDGGPDGWDLQYSTEFHMANDSKLFPPRPKWEADGYRADEYSRWLKGNWRPVVELWTELGVKELPEGERRCAQPPYDTIPIARVDIPEGIVLSRHADMWLEQGRIDDVALPLYEGRMIGQFDFSQKGWVSGKGRAAVWRDIDWATKVLEPQYLMSAATLTASDKGSAGPKAAYMPISSSTNARTTIATYLRDLPAGHSVSFFVPGDADVQRTCVVSGLLSSYAFDLVIRKRLGGLNMSAFVMVEAPLPFRAPRLVELATHPLLSLSLADRGFAREWLLLAGSHARATVWQANWALTRARRLEQRAAFDAMVACWYGLTAFDLRQAFADCDWPRSTSTALLDVKGFWRVDKDEDPELRHTVLTLVAFNDLEEKIQACAGDRDQGIADFLAQNDGGGWMLPQSVRLADHGLGHDDRAKEHQPVASRLGARFHDWQIVQTAADSWRECRLHARNLLGGADCDELPAAAAGKMPEPHVGAVSTPKATPLTSSPQESLFG